MTTLFQMTGWDHETDWKQLLLLEESEPLLIGEMAAMLDKLTRLLDFLYNLDNDLDLQFRPSNALPQTQPRVLA
jgi:hypothetical protein